MCLPGRRVLGGIRISKYPLRSTLHCIHRVTWEINQPYMSLPFWIGYLFKGAYRFMDVNPDTLPLLLLQAKSSTFPRFGLFPFVCDLDSIVKLCLIRALNAMKTPLHGKDLNCLEDGAIWKQNQNYRVCKTSDGRTTSFSIYVLLLTSSKSRFFYWNYACFVNIIFNNLFHNYPLYINLLIMWLGLPQRNIHN